MRRLLPMILLSIGCILSVTYAVSQQTSSSNPPIGIACAFNTILPTITTGRAAWVQCDSAGRLITAGSGIQSVTLTGNSGTPTQSAISITNASTKVLDAATATIFVKLCVAVSAPNSVRVQWDGGTATTAAPAEEIPPGQCDSWTQSTGFLPTSQINAISTTAVTVPVSLIYK